MANYANIFVFLLISLLNSNLTSGAALNTITDTTGAGNFQYLGKYEHHYPSPSSSISSVNTSSNDIAENKAEVDSTTITAATSFYFLSQNSAGWTTGANDCKAYLGANATLLYIDTAEELAAVVSFLDGSDDTGSSYWTGGRYDPETAAFVWDSGVKVGTFVPWDQGHPDTSVPVTRVSAYTAAGSLKLRTEFQTVSNRYICELSA